MDYVKDIKPLKEAENWKTWDWLTRNNHMLDVQELFDMVDFVERVERKPFSTCGFDLSQKRRVYKSTTQAKKGISQCVSDTSPPYFRYLHHIFLVDYELWMYKTFWSSSSIKRQKISFFCQSLSFLCMEWCEAVVITYF